MYSSKVQVPECFIRSENVASSSKCLNFSKFSISNSNASFLQGFPCNDDISLKNQLEISSPISVSSEDSAKTTSKVDLKLDSGIEGMDLNALFDDESFPPNKISLDLPKDLLSLVTDCGIILA